MGQTVTLTKPQIELLSEIGADPFFTTQFYLTGGTALSAFYYHHRESEDLDLFTEKPFDQEYVRAWMLTQKNKLGWDYTYTQVIERQTYEVRWKRNHTKVEFVHYDFKRQQDPQIWYKGVAIDRLGDIAVNKLLSISQRTAPKDFVDLYYLLSDFTFWDLMLVVEKKFGMEIEPIYLSALLTKADEFDVLGVKMLKPLSLGTLKKFFRSQALAIAGRMVKK